MKVQSTFLMKVFTKVTSVHFLARHTIFEHDPTNIHPLVETTNNNKYKLLFNFNNRA